MLFNSHIFIFAFLPITLAGYLALAALSATTLARVWLLLTSLVFYGWWNPPYLLLLILSILFNYVLAGEMSRKRASNSRGARRLLVFGVITNLAALGWFKYATFVADNVGALVGLDFAMTAVVLPLAISFYTFQQVAYLVDTYRGEAPPYSLLDYALFVTFFPQLIAGPIVHHGELTPQFQQSLLTRFDANDMAAGIAFFVIGLLKKLAIADPVGALAAPTFAGAGTPGALEAWLAVSAFTIGLYFDFSGYSDMAVGLARMFGIRLPYNFASPYQAISIIEFWRRWHITLSRFLRDYVYIPLGGNRYGATRRYLNLVLTMLLGGIWHGAGWTFVAWGALHGVYLLLNHSWNGIVTRAAEAGRQLALPTPVARGATLLAVMVAWVFFASPEFGTALDILTGMTGMNGIGPWPPVVGAGALVGVALGRAQIGLEGGTGFLALLGTAGALCAFALGWLLVLFTPNTQAIVDGAALPHHWRVLRFRPTAAMAVVVGAAFVLAVTLMADVKEFVYFQF